MVIFWCLKFSKDEDLCLVSYKDFQKNEEKAFPVLSMCFRSPVIDGKLREIDAKINASSYLQFLKGDIYDEKMAHIDYSHVSMMLLDYLLGYRISFKNGSYVFYSQANFTGEGIDSVTYNGLWYDWIFKCFGFDLNLLQIGNINFFIAHFKFCRS